MPSSGPRPHVICPKCGKKGFLTKRWVRGSRYFVKYATALQFTSSFPQDCVRIYEPTGDGYNFYEFSCVDKKTGKKLLIDQRKEVGSKAKVNKRVIEVLPTREYTHYYVGHYDPNKYKEQMIRYKKGELKSKPNGRKWCSWNTDNKDGLRALKLRYLRGISV